MAEEFKAAEAKKADALAALAAKDEVVSDDGAAIVVTCRFPLVATAAPVS